MKKHRKLLTLGVVICLVAGLVAGIVYYKQVEEERKLSLIYIPKVVDGTNDFWTSLIQGAEMAAKEYNADIRVWAPEEENDVDGQNKLIERATEEKPDAILISPSSFTESDQLLKKAKEQGIHIAFIDSYTQEEVQDLTVATDNLEAGQILGRFAKDLVGADDQIAIVSHVKGVSTAVEREKGFRIDDKKMIEDSKKLFQDLNIEINPKEKMKNLTVGKQQMCEIAKAISHKAEVIIFDEPSAALTEKEIADLFEIIRDLRKKNLGIVYISHRMDEIKTITDRVTVMRDGGYVGTLITKDSTKEDIINMMVGRVIYEDPKQESAVPADAPVVLKVEHLNAGKMVQDVSFELRKGEILGFSGLMGAGRTETARALFGADPKQSGKISVMGKDGQLHEVTINSPQDAVKYGIGYLSEDRRRYGCVVQKSVTENTTLATMEEFTNGIFINKAKEKKVAEKYVNELATKTPTTDQLVVNLSGGNQQKVVIAKWLTRDSDILIFDEPTRGIDVGAKNEIYKLMNRLAAEGKSIIMISSEMTEVLRMSDRIIIMCEGKVTGCIDISEATQENIMDKATRNID